MRALTDRTFADIAALMHATVGLSFGPAKKALVSSRLTPRIQRLGLDGFEAYLRLIEREPGGDEMQVAIDLLTTNETYFFREPAHFEIMAQALAAAGPTAPAVWSAASSFGDEAYSAAMVLADLEQRGAIGSQWSVLGTDISDRVLRAAARGVFPEERLREVSRERLKRYCLRGEGESAGLAALRPEIARRVRFGQLNLCEPIEPLGPFDVIFLRNVLIYFDAETRQAVIERVLEQLVPGGLLFIGMAEGRATGGTALQVLGPGAFRKLPC